MKIFKNIKFLPVVITSLLLIMTGLSVKSIAAQSQPTVDLGTTSTFAVLAGTEITNTGNTTISGSVGGNVGGDVGLFPGTSFTHQETVTISGAVHLTDAVAIKAQEDLVTAYDDAAGRTPVTIIPTELGDTTLIPGVYASNSGTFDITGTLTLDAQGDPNAVFIFKTDSTLITASRSNVNLVNSARFCRTFWKVGSSATLGVDSNFAGHIFALTSITANSGAVVQGQLLARNGAVTLNNNTITNGICDTILPTATLHVINHVVNDDSGTSVANKFNIHVKISGNDVTASPAAGAESPGNTYILAAGTYVVSEDAFPGYTVSYSGDSDSSGNITLVPGDNKTITITNNDIPVSSGGSDDSSLDNGQLVVNTPVISENGVTSTVTGGQLPKTSTPLYNIILIGSILIIVGVVGWRSRKRYE